MEKGQINESVSVVFTFEKEIFLIQRQVFLKAFPGHYAFPGGKIEEVDKRKKDSIFGLPSTHLQAIEREIQEEMKISILAFNKAGGVKNIIFIGEALTPNFNPVRFNNFFYLIEVNKRPTFILDENEISMGCWRTPLGWIDEYHRGKILLVPVIRNILFELNENIKRDKFNSIAFEYDENELPIIEGICGLKQVLVLSNTLPPAKHTNAFILGDEKEKKFLIDPAPRDISEYTKLKNTLKKQKIDGIILTHHHRDHHENSPQLARELKLPIALSKKTLNLIQGKWGHDYLDRKRINFLSEGQVLTKWLGQDVKVFEIPGHDEGQIGFAPESMDWFIVGDLIQGIGTVVIAKPEGDMAVYYQSLERIISLNPKTIFPSHGIGLGSVFRIRQVLEHRKERERSIKDLYLEGKTEEQILETLYSDVPEILWKAARQNIKSHLIKLKKEGEI